MRRRDWQLGGESSGHILCLDLSTTGDGIIAALQTVVVEVWREVFPSELVDQPGEASLVPMVESGRTLRELKQGMSKLPQAMVNVEVADPSAVAVCEKVVR